MLKIALTGGVASGKSTVTALLEKHGVATVDADQAARAVVQAGSEGLADVVAAFGQSVLCEQGLLNRAALRRLVFAKPSAKATLESILHPKIRQWMQQQVAEKSRSHRFVIEVIPLLLETQQCSRFDVIVVVDVAESVQLTRLQARDGSPPEQALQIVQSQASRAERLAVADVVIDNHEGPEALLAQVAQLLDYLDQHPKS